MQSEIPTPQTTLAILLAASEWPQFPDFQQSKAFVNSANGLKSYLLGPGEFGLPKDNLLDLFNSKQSPDDIDRQIGDFLEKRISEMRLSGYPARDVLFYFVGHGGFSGNNLDYFLAIWRTRESNPSASSLQIANLAHTLKDKARHLRHTIILDCCFAASATKFFQGAEPTQAAIKQTVDAFKVQHKGHGFPGRGTSLLCSSRHNVPSLISPDGEYTMFSQALLYVLRDKSSYQKGSLSLRAVANLADDYLWTMYGDKQAPKPEIHSPDQSEGDVADVPFFAGTRVNGIKIFPIDATMDEKQREYLLQMEQILHTRVIGQDEAIRAISRVVRRAWTGLKDRKYPIGSFIFVGSQGVGKTELARALADFLFGSEDALIEFNMSEYMERHSSARLLGAPPGYVGYEQGGQLTEAIRSKPYSVVLLDEIEKAHPEILNVLLQICQEGKLTDTRGRLVDFHNTVVILTSKVGQSLLDKVNLVAFKRSKDNLGPNLSEYDAARAKILGELKNLLRPEILYSIDEIIFFTSLNYEEMYQLVELLLKRIRAHLAEQQIELIVSQATKDYLIEKGFDPKFGARPLRRNIQRLVEDLLAEGLLQSKFQPGDVIEADIIDDELILMVRKRIDALPLPSYPEASDISGVELNINVDESQT